MIERTDMLGPVVELAVLVRKARLTGNIDRAILIDAYNELLATVGCQPDRIFPGPIGALGRILKNRQNILGHGALLMNVQWLLDSDAMDSSFLRASATRGQA